jgi:hypothetical protein
MANKIRKYKLEEVFDFRLGGWRVTNNATLELRGKTEKGSEIHFEANIPVWWFDDIAKSMWRVIEQQQKQIDVLKAAMQTP